MNVGVGGYDFTPDPSTFTSSSTSLSSYPNTPSAPVHQHHSPYGPPGYFDMTMGSMAYPQPGYPGMMGSSGGYPSWNASQRAFSPVPNYGANTGSWYTAGFGWPMR